MYLKLKIMMKQQNTYLKYSVKCIWLCRMRVFVNFFLFTLYMTDWLTFHFSGKSLFGPYSVVTISWYVLSFSETFLHFNKLYTRSQGDLFQISVSNRNKTVYFFYPLYHNHSCFNFLLRKHMTVYLHNSSKKVKFVYQRGLRCFEARLYDNLKQSFFSYMHT